MGQSIPIRDDDDKGRQFNYRGYAVALKSGRLTLLRSMSPQRRARVRQYLAGNLPPANSEIWGKVAAGVMADLGYSMEVNPNE